MVEEIKEIADMVPQAVAGVDATIATVPDAAITAPMDTPVPAPVQVPTKIVNIYPQEFQVVSDYNNQSDCVCIDVVLNVDVYETAYNSGQHGKITKRLVFSKNALANDLAKKDATTQATFVEEIVHKSDGPVIPPTQPIKEGKSTVQRMRELAGIPHNKNWV